MKDEHSGKCRLIGIDLAWGKRDGSEPAGSGCAELVWKDGKRDELELKRLDVLGRVDKIVEWIQPDGGDWVVAIDAPLVICNKTGERSAEEQMKRYYRRFDASARPASLKNPDFRKHYQGRMIRKRLKELGGTLVERAEDLNGKSLFFETYPHPATVELFDLNLIIKYKMKDGMVKEQRRAGQQELADRIRTHFCDRPIGPRLRLDDRLTNLLSEPDPKATHKELKEREDKLDGLICAYVAAWADAGRCLQRFGEDGKGVMLIPCLRPCMRPSLP